ncbi:hypothetical protein IE077_004296 [Cardiosporidium cionae]|uniref:SURF1-like protein n=1 Tax=Cardiosporidium cionae TaxID=476202 RepID=A0ABQ7JCD7_9APIC|nr:hypothetical protein IE077_004296 [Cardiosporidium cionae]|eukprot:KAF8821682.1 hypothetical protein IE077_004296 [Cardiosporidium cionae]
MAFPSRVARPFLSRRCCGPISSTGAVSPSISNHVSQNAFPISSPFRKRILAWEEVYLPPFMLPLPPLGSSEHRAETWFRVFSFSNTIPSALFFRGKRHSLHTFHGFLPSSCLSPIYFSYSTEQCRQGCTLSLLANMHTWVASSRYTKPYLRMVKMHSSSLSFPLKSFFLSSFIVYSSAVSTANFSASFLHTPTFSPHASATSFHPTAPIVSLSSPATSPDLFSTSPYIPSTALHPTAPMPLITPAPSTSDIPSSFTSHPPVTEPSFLPALRRFTPQVPGQVLYPASPEDIRILSQSTHKYPLPLSVEGGVIVRLVRLGEIVTSPVSRCVRNRQFGIRGGSERWQLLAFGFLFSGGLSLLGFWQLKRMKWKVALVEHRRSQLAFPRVTIAPHSFEEALPWNPTASSSLPPSAPTAPPPPPPPTVLSLLYPFFSLDAPSSQPLEGWAYRSVELKGVLDTSYTLPVGPRTGAMSGKPGYLLVSPLRLEDGRSVLVNRGHCPMETLSAVLENTAPAWVIIRAVVDPGELLTPFLKKIRMKGKANENQYVTLEPESLGEHVGAVNVQECQLCILSAYDILYLDDIGATAETISSAAATSKVASPFISSEKHSVQKLQNVLLEMKQKKDYLCFWADEYTHFNYACQWFIMAAAVFGMTLYKFIEVTRWRF